MNKRILIIEDESALQDALGETFSAKGYEVERAMDGDAGVSMAKVKIPDVVILDLILPKKSGFEVLEELKKDSSTKNIPILVLTNLEGSADVERALTGGATTYLVKTNYSLNEIVNKTESLLAHGS